MSFPAADQSLILTNVEQLNPSDSEIFSALFSSESLLEVFNEKFANSTGKGVDRLNGFQFRLRAEDELTIASKKILSATYRFAPYLEVLKTKGRGKNPRVIGIPTIRDRVVLSQLSKFLSHIYPERVPKNVAATYVREISKDLEQVSATDTWICTTDIRTFYDSIERDRLLKLLSKKIQCSEAAALVKHAIFTPTIPKNTRKTRHKEYKTLVGVPQGLAISNILASIYMQPIDDEMTKMPISYYRYVDDVLLYGSHQEVHSAFKSLGGRLKRRGLGLHPLNSGKSKIVQSSSKFGYLGYIFDNESITVRDSTIEGFLHSIAAKFSDYVHNRAKRLERYKYLTPERLREIFLLELNERITGAIKDKKRYGWIAYFSQITDLSLLHKLDHAIRGLFGRLDDFENSPPSSLKSLRRAYWEMKFNPQGGYIRDYDKFSTVAHKLAFLVERGRVGGDDQLTDEQIIAKFDAYVQHNLSAMLADEGAIYG